jgi:hypothetical protein
LSLFASLEDNRCQIAGAIASHSLSPDFRRIALIRFPTKVMDVLTAINHRRRSIHMTTMIDDQATAAAPGQEQKPGSKGNTAPRRPLVAASKGKSGKKTTPAKKAPKAPKAPKKAKAAKVDSNNRRIALLVFPTRVMNVIVTVSRAERGAYMKTFTIDSDNNISVFTSKKEAAAVSATPFDPFASQSELADLATDWPMSRLVEIWNSIPGVTAVTKFTNRKVATERIWKAIQGLGTTAPKSESAIAEPVVVVIEAQPAVAEEAAAAEAGGPAVAEVPEPPANTEPALAETVVDAGAQVPDEAPVPPDLAPKPARQKKALKAPKKAVEPKTGGIREGSKTATVIALLQRPNGATLEEIMAQMGWQKHTVRGFMAGAMKKAGHTVESFKSEKGERTYRINQ